jgi:aryl-alcohol dehydrogenase-like predicted oxidoreductase
MLAGAVTPDVLAAASDGDFRRDDPRFSGEHLRRNLDLVGELRRLAEERARTPAQLALAWLLAQGSDASARQDHVQRAWPDIVE